MIKMVRFDVWIFIPMKSSPPFVDIEHQLFFYLFKRMDIWSYQDHLMLWYYGMHAIGLDIVCSMQDLVWIRYEAKNLYRFINNKSIGLFGRRKRAICMCLLQRWFDYDVGYHVLSSESSINITRDREYSRFEMFCDLPWLYNSCREVKNHVI